MYCKVCNKKSKDQSPWSEKYEKYEKYLLYSEVRVKKGTLLYLKRAAALLLASNLKSASVFHSIFPLPSSLFLPASSDCKRQTVGFLNLKGMIDTHWPHSSLYL